MKLYVYIYMFVLTTDELGLLTGARLDCCVLLPNGIIIGMVICSTLCNNYFFILAYQQCYPMYVA